MKRLLVLLTLILAGCSTPPLTPQVLGQAPTRPVTTPTPLPSATIGYEATARVAEATSVQAVRLMAEVTLQSIQATRVAEDHRFQIAEWTKNAPATPTPDFAMTATEQSLDAQALALASAKFTATAYAPTAEYMATIAKQDVYIRPIGMAVVLILALAIAFAAVRLALIGWAPEPAKEVPPVTHAEVLANRIVEAEALGAAVAGTVITLDRPHERSADRIELPCTPEQLTALAEGILHNNATLAFRVWTGEGRPFARDEKWNRLREVLLANGMALKTTQGALVATPLLRDVLTRWLDQGDLPTSITLAQEGAEIASQDAHAHAGAVALDPDPPFIIPVEDPSSV